MAELVGGAIVGTALSKLIKLTQRARRCKEECKILRNTLKQVQPLLDKFNKSPELKNLEVEEWLAELHKNLNEGRGYLEDCLFNFTLKGGFKYVRRRFLSSRIQDINRRIQQPLPSVLVTFTMLQEIGRKVDSLCLTSPVIVEPAAF